MNICNKNKQKVFEERMFKLALNMVSNTIVACNLNGCI
jgi:hypothetical protein